MGNNSPGQPFVALGDSARLPLRVAVALALLVGAAIAAEGSAQPRLQANLYGARNSQRIGIDLAPCSFVRSFERSAPVAASF